MIRKDLSLAKDELVSSRGIFSYNLPKKKERQRERPSRSNLAGNLSKLLRAWIRGEGIVLFKFHRAKRVTQWEKERENERGGGGRGRREAATISDRN